MEQLEPPDTLLWDERRLWFEREEQQRSKPGVERVSEQAAALIIDLQAVFCAGAWAAVVILAAAIVDSQAEASRRRRAAPASELRWLRALRNRLVHENRADPAITVEDQWTGRKEWERAARRAVSLVFQVLYPGPVQEGSERR